MIDLNFRAKFIFWGSELRNISITSLVGDVDVDAIEGKGGHMASRMTFDDFLQKLFGHFKGGLVAASEATRTKEFEVGF